MIDTTWTPTKTTASPPRKRCRSSIQFGRGPRPAATLVLTAPGPRARWRRAGPRRRCRRRGRCTTRAGVAVIAMRRPPASRRSGSAPPGTRRSPAVASTGRRGRRRAPRRRCRRRGRTRGRAPRSSTALASTSAIQPAPATTVTSVEVGRRTGAPVPGSIRWWRALAVDASSGAAAWSRWRPRRRPARAARAGVDQSGARRRRSSAPPVGAAPATRRSPPRFTHAPVGAGRHRARRPPGRRPGPCRCRPGRSRCRPAGATVSAASTSMSAAPSARVRLGRPAAGRSASRRTGGRSRPASHRAEHGGVERAAGQPPGLERPARRAARCRRDTVDGLPGRPVERG